MPPRLAPYQVVIVPIAKTDEDRAKITEIVDRILASLTDIRVYVDDREQYGLGWKFSEWEVKGVPVRIEIGPRDAAAGHAMVVRRDTGDKQTMALDMLGEGIPSLLETIQRDMFERARTFRETSTQRVDNYETFRQIAEERSGFIEAGWCGSPECEATIKEDTKNTIRCIPMNRASEAGQCVHCGQPSDGRVVFAQAY